MALFLTGRRYLKFGGSMPAINLTNCGDLNVAASSADSDATLTRQMSDEARLATTDVTSVGWSRAMTNYATAVATEDRCREIVKKTLARTVISVHDCLKTAR